MDLYKWAYKLLPAVPSGSSSTRSSSPATSASSTCGPRPTTSPPSGTQPVRIETAEGRAEYVAAQRGFAARGTVLRTRLLAALEPLVS